MRVIVYRIMAVEIGSTADEAVYFTVFGFLSTSSSTLSETRALADTSLYSLCPL